MMSSNSVIVKHMTVVRNPGTTDTPCLKIANCLLKANGFVIGVPVRVFYRTGKIVITSNLENQHEHYVQKPCPITNPAQDSSCARDEEKSDGHAECRPPNPARNPADVRKLSIFRPIFAGYGGDENLSSYSWNCGSKVLDYQ